MQTLSGVHWLVPVALLASPPVGRARESLLRAAASASVTAIATEYGFAHYGRFSGEYRRCFGETPSATLRRARTAALSRLTDPSPSGRRPKPAPGLFSREPPSVTVLPCETLAPDRWFGESLAEGTAAALCRVRSLSIALAMRPVSKPPTRYLLTGRIVEAGRWRVILRLVEAETGRHIWGDSFDGDRADPLELHIRVIEGVMRAVPSRIRGSEIHRARRLRPQHLDAYGLAMRAPFRWCSRLRARQRDARWGFSSGQ